ENSELTRGWRWDGAQLALLAISFLLLKLGTIYWERSHLPLGPFPFPILGNLWQLSFQLHPEPLRGIVSLQLAHTHGNVLTMWVGSMPVVVLNGFWVVKEALVSNSEQFSGRPLTPLFRDLFQERGIICSNGHRWRQQRRFCLVTLCGLGLGKLALELQLQEEAADLAEAFQQEQGRPFNPQVPIIKSMARVTGALMFGHCFLLEEPFLQELTQAIDFGLAIVSTIWHSWGGRLVGQRCLGTRRLCGAICQEISRHKLRTSEAPKDFISCYLAQINEATDDPISTFNEENLIQVVSDLFLGGTDTTATTLCWALIYMVQHGAIQERVQRELDMVLGTSQAVHYEDQERLPYTCALAVSYRNILPNGSFFLSQLLLRDYKFRNQLPLQGTIVLLNLASVLYDPQCWETPRQFNPGHFLDKNGNFLVNEASLLFSAGTGHTLPDVCRPLRTFRFQLPEGSPGLRLEYIFGGTRQPQPQKIFAVPHLNCYNPGPREEGL
uniref:Uncharacterized protein n=1 Tax=Sus scrofa TaxID=9823 RepID=A0A8D1C7N8_PIG